MSFADADYPALPYPGARPPCSFAHLDGTGHPLTPDPTALAGWRLGGEDLDGWLADRGAAPLAGRVPLLCYGSNACPAKLTWLRATLGLTGPAVLLRARCTGLAAVWAAGLRVVDDQRPATLAALPGAETHAIWLATPDQFAVLDRCEGRGDRYRLAHLTTGEVRLEDGTLVERPLAYVANSHPATARTNRFPLLVDGRPVRCTDVPQAAAAALDGVPAASDGLALLVVDGVPVPDDSPRRLFVPGTLRPGAAHWPMLAPHVTGEPRRARLPGTGADGWLVELARTALLSTVDESEGAGNRRVRVTLEGGTQAWTYVPTGPSR